MTKSDNTVNATSPGARIPCLDGLRAVAILLVLFSHVRQTNQFPEVGWLLAPQMRIIGTAGVCLFFIISGYLITTLLLQEKERYGACSLPKFYMRRMLRIFPAFYLFICVIVILRHIGFVNFTNGGLIFSAAYLRNFYVNTTDFILRHTWTLAVEEQFYLLWPLCIARFSNRRCLLLATIIALMWPMVHVVKHGLGGSMNGTDALNTASGDTILYGCALAIVARQHNLLSALRGLSSGSIPLLLSTLILALIYGEGHRCHGTVALILPIVRNLSILCILWWCINNSKSLVGRALSTAPAIYIGGISYSLYIWQQLFLFPGKTAFICSFPVNLLMAVGVATSSYYLLERPINTYRTRFARSAGVSSSESVTLPELNASA